MLLDLDETGFVYVGDPLCSWCWGITPEVAVLREKYADDYPFDIVLGGLSPYERYPLDHRAKQYLREHWENVHRTTGQPINFDILENGNTFVYNTEPASRAVVTVREIAPELTFPFFEALQRNFYVNNVFPQDLKDFLPLLDRFYLREEEFLPLFRSEEIRKRTHDDFMWAKQVGVKGFPTLLLRHKGELFAVSLGYSTSDSLLRISSNILAGKEPGEPV